MEMAWKHYSELFVSEWMKAGGPAISAVLVACPSRNNQPDHALLFARSVSELTGIPLISALELLDSKEQKNLSRWDRNRQALKRFALNPAISEKISQEKPVTIYFVDDIITTGATVRAANVHLRKLGRVKAISLIIRE